MFKLHLEKAEEPETKLPTSMEKSRKFQEKKSTSVLLIILKPLCRSQQTVENCSRDGNIRPPDLLLRNQYAGQEATVRAGHGRIDWFQTGKGVCQGCILSPCLFHLYAEYIMWNSGLDEAQAGIKIARRNINNLRYADDTTLMAESEEELKSLLMKWKRRVKKLA